MNKKLIMGIMNKYIEILSWLEKEGYIHEPRSAKLKEDSKQGILHFDEFTINLIRGNHYLEMGAPSREDLEVFTASVDFEYNITGTIEVMKKFIQWLTKFEIPAAFGKIEKPECFKNCYFETFILSKKTEPQLLNKHNHELQSQWGFEIRPDYKDNPHIKEQAKKPLLFYIPFKVTYNIATIDLAFHQPKKQIEGQRSLL